jgi:hypothetical protein
VTGVKRWMALWPSIQYSPTAMLVPHCGRPDAGERIDSPTIVWALGQAEWAREAETTGL